MGLILLLIGLSVSIYRPDFKDVHSYSVFAESPNISYTLTNKDTDNNELDKLIYEPNVHSFTGIAVSNDYGTLSLSAQNIDQEKSHIDSSTLFDLQLMGHFRKHIWEAYYQNYQGLYVSNSSIISSDLPRVNTWSYGIAVKHFSNDSFEAKESYGNYSKIKTTNWSLVQGLYLNKSRLYSSKTLVPDQYNASFSQLEGLKALETSTLGIEAGVTGLYSFYNFHISGMLAIGWHVQKQEYSGIHSDDRTVSDSAVSSLVELGHNGLSGASFGVQVRNQAINIPIKNASYALERSTFSLYYKYFF